MSEIYSYFLFWLFKSKAIQFSHEDITSESREWNEYSAKKDHTYHHKKKKNLQISLTILYKLCSIKKVDFIYNLIL